MTSITNPSLFGPLIWNFIHMQSKLYGYEYIVVREMEAGLGGVSDEHVKQAIIENIEKSKKKVKSIREFIENIPDFVPCEMCSVHAQKFINDHQPPLENLKTPDDLFLWSVDFHNQANKHLGKKELNYNEAASEFNKYWSLERLQQGNNLNKEQNKEETTSDLDIAVLSIGIVLIVFVVLLLGVSLYFHMR